MTDDELMTATHPHSLTHWHHSIEVTHSPHSHRSIVSQCHSLSVSHSLPHSVSQCPSEPSPLPPHPHTSHIHPLTHCSLLTVTASSIHRNMQTINSSIHQDRDINLESPHQVVKHVKQNTEYTNQYLSTFNFRIEQCHSPSLTHCPSASDID